jgi:hypothetical protein
MACGEDVHERLLVAIAHGLAANFFRRLLGSRYVPGSGTLEFVRFEHDRDCPLTWNNGVATNVQFLGIGNRPSPGSGTPDAKHGVRFCFHDSETVLPLCRCELAAMSSLACEAERAIAGDLTKLSGCGHLFETTWSRRLAIDIEAPRREIKLNRVHFENRGSVGLQPGNAPTTRHLRAEPPDYGFQNGRGLRSKQNNVGLAGNRSAITGGYRVVSLLSWRACPYRR